MTKPTQDGEFNILWDRMMGVTESQYPGPGNIKQDLEDKIINYGQKAATNVESTHN